MSVTIEGIFHREGTGQSHVEVDNTKFAITDRAVILGRALDGDQVRWHSTGGDWTLTVLQRPARTIVGVLNLRSTRLYGRNKKGHNIYGMVPLEPRWPHFQVASSLRDRSCNVYIQIEFKEWIIGHDLPVGTIIELIGRTDDPMAEERALLLKNRLCTKIPKWSIGDLSANATPRPHFANAITIDPAGSKDFDDAFSLEGDSVFVHIADVDSLIAKGVPMSDIREWGNLETIYGDTVYPMLPRHYSEELLSLNTQGRKNTITIELRAEGTTLVPQRAFLSTIEVERNWTYEEAQQDLSSSPYRDIFRLTGETDTHKVIERLMVICNAYVGTVLNRHGMTFLRCAELRAADMPVTGPWCYGPGYYSTVAAPHAAISVPDFPLYTHFTSPIRRAADLIVARLLKGVLAGSTQPAYSPAELENFVNLINDCHRRTKRFYRERALGQLIRTLGPGRHQMYGTILGYEPPHRASIYLEYGVSHAGMGEGIMFKGSLFHRDLSECISPNVVGNRLQLTGALEDSIPLYERLELYVLVRPEELTLDRKLIIIAPITQVPTDPTA